MKEKEKERAEILKRLGLSDDATPDAFASKIAQLRQNYEIRARIYPKRIEAEEWLSFLDYAESALQSQTAEDLGQKTDQDFKKTENSSFIAEEKVGQQIQSTHLGPEGAAAIKQEQMPGPPQDQTSSEANPYASNQGTPPQLGPAALAKTPKYVPWWLTPILMIGLLFAPLVFHVKSSAVEPKSEIPSVHSSNHKPSSLRLALYDLPSIVVHYSVASDPASGIELIRARNLAKLTPRTDTPAIPFGLLVVPFTMAVQNSARFKAAGWELIWVCDESNTMDRILLLKDIQDTPEDVIRGDWLTVKNTRAAHQLDVYLDQVTTKKAKYKHDNLKELDSPEEVLQNINDSTQVVAIPEPWAESPQLTGFVDVTESLASHAQHEINVVLARKELVTNAESRTILVRFLKNLLEYPRKPGPNGVDTHAIFTNDPKLREDVSFTEISMRSGRENFIVQQDYPVELKNNLEFLYDFSDFSCSSIAEDQAAHITWEKKHHSSPCLDLIDKNDRDLLISDLQKVLQDPPRFSERERDQLCSSNNASERADILWPFVYNSFDPSARVDTHLAPAEKLKDFVAANHANADRSFCLVGHGDAPGTPKDNDQLGRRRAEEILELLAKQDFFKQKLPLCHMEIKIHWIQKTRKRTGEWKSGGSTSIYSNDQTVYILFPFFFCYCSGWSCWRDGLFHRK